MEDVGFAVEEVALLPSGDLRITLPLPNVSYAYGQESWVLSAGGGGWHVSLPVSEGEWPVVGTFTP